MRVGMCVEAISLYLVICLKTSASRKRWLSVRFGEKQYVQ